jgi:hypothetical protein
MKLHEREEVVQRARIALSKALLGWLCEYGEELTFGEELSIVQGELGTQISSMAKYKIRHERHGDEDKPGGLE